MTLTGRFEAFPPAVFLFTRNNLKHPYWVSVENMSTQVEGKPALPVENSSIAWNLQLINQSLAADEPVIPDPNNPGFSVAWLCETFGQIEQPRKYVDRARERGVLLCVMRRKAVVRLSEFWKLFDESETQSVLE